MIVMIIEKYNCHQLRTILFPHYFSFKVNNIRRKKLLEIISVDFDVESQQLIR